MCPRRRSGGNITFSGYLTAQIMHIINIYISVSYKMCYIVVALLPCGFGSPVRSGLALIFYNLNQMFFLF